MSEQQNSAFGKFIPGFDFLQSLAKGATQSLPQMPNLSSWVAPTLNLEELDKRIGELKAVHFWLDQNRAALAATIQALEVQKMTLATLKGMNFNMSEMADALKLKTPAAPVGGGTEQPQAAGQSAPAPEPEPPKRGPARKGGKNSKSQDSTEARVVDPLQWWGALTQQFQQIAAGAMQDAAAAGAAMTSGSAGAAGTAQSEGEGKSGPGKKPGAKRPARKAASR
jgi:hypothetical protein